MKTNRPLSSVRKQSGVVLVVSIILLLVLTLIGLSSMRGTTLEERMAGNWRDANYALQSAEAGLRGAETFLRPLFLLPTDLTYPDGCSDGDECPVFAHSRLSHSEHDPTADLLTTRITATNADTHPWMQASQEYNEIDLPGVATPPRYLIEHRDFVRDHLVTGFGSSQETGRDQYQITARGTGQSDEAEVILQSGYSKRFN
ncbi:MAG TPA: PilX N-terminal domain-containing pilus assembly protein [Thauera sp.]|nr:PilX N-terminal domain-containing pilus assembly protein [Thauera sp.]